MTRLRELVSKLFGLFGRARRERMLDDEIRVHVDLIAEDYERRGMTPDDARAAAQREFGGVAQMKEAHRDVRTWPWFATVVQDLRYAGRALRGRWTFTATAIATLALGIGANTAIFSVAYSLLMRPLPYRAPDQLVTIASWLPFLPPEYTTAPVRAKDFLEFQRASSTFAGMAALGPADFNLTGDGEPERLYGARVSASLFDMLGTTMAHGRAFRPDEDLPGNDRVVVISHALWTSRFGNRPDLVGQPIQLNGQSFLVVGILPRDFLFPVGMQLHPTVRFGPRIDVWKPMAFADNERTAEGSWNYAVIARLRDGVTTEQARHVLNSIAQTTIAPLRRQRPDITMEMHVTPFREVFSTSGRRGLALLVAAVGLLLVIVCVNLAHLWLDRAMARRREFATRAALGAPRWRIVQQLLSECLIVAVGGCGLGLLLAHGGTRVLAAIGPVDFVSVQIWQFDTTVVVFSAAIALVAGLLFGVVPALHTARGAAAPHLSSRGRTADAGHTRLRRTLLVAQVALCTSVLAVAGLLLHSFAKASTVERGLVTENVLSVALALPADRYGTSRTLAFYQEALGRVRALPGVMAASAVNSPPFIGGGVNVVYAEEDLPDAIDRPLAFHRVVASGYFSTLGIPLVAGRFLDEREDTPVVLISERLARHLWPTADPASIVGRRVGRRPAFQTVVGIVGDIREEAPDRASLPAVYRPHQQSPSRDMTLFVRSAHDAAGLASAIRHEVRQLDADLPVGAIRTMDDIVQASLSERRFQLVIVLAFAMAGLALAAIGVYGVTSVSVASRTQEIGLRLALGATPSAVLRQTLTAGFVPVVAGVCLGLLLGGAAGFAVQSMLFGIEPVDLLTFASVTGVLLAIGLLACYLPARRASRLDPIDALRCE